MKNKFVTIALILAICLAFVSYIGFEVFRFLNGYGLYWEIKYSSAINQSDFDNMVLNKMGKGSSLNKNTIYDSGLTTYEYKVETILVFQRLFLVVDSNGLIHKWRCSTFFRPYPKIRSKDEGEKLYFRSK